MRDDLLDKVRQIALSLPGVAEGTSYGTPAFKLKDKLLARIYEDGETLVLRMDFETRDFLLHAKPGVYYLTDHYQQSPYILIRIQQVHHDDLKDNLLHSWYRIAPKKLVKQYEDSM